MQHVGLAMLYINAINMKNLTKNLSLLFITLLILVSFAFSVEKAAAQATQAEKACATSCMDNDTLNQRDYSTPGAASSLKSQCGRGGSYYAAPYVNESCGIAYDNCLSSCKNQNCGNLNCSSSQTCVAYNNSAFSCLPRGTLPTGGFCEGINKLANDQACKSGYCNPTTLRCDSQTTVPIPTTIALSCGQIFNSADCQQKGCLWTSDEFVDASFCTTKSSVSATPTPIAAPKLTWKFLDICPIPTTTTAPTRTPVATTAPVPTSTSTIAPTSTPTIAPTQTPRANSSPTGVPTVRPASTPICPTNDHGRCGAGTPPDPTCKSVLYPVGTKILNCTNELPNCWVCPQPTSTPTPTAIPTPTPLPGSKQIALTIKVDGIPEENTTPITQNRRPVVVTVRNPNAQDIAKTGFVNYSTFTGLFTGTVDLGTEIPNIPLNISLEMGHSKGFAYDVSLNQGTTQLPKITVRTGLNTNDNLDTATYYSALVSCFNGKPKCSNLSLADINDDGKADGTDFNIFLKSIQFISSRPTRL
jgi:hypothetical protein